MISSIEMLTCNRKDLANFWDSLLILAHNQAFLDLRRSQHEMKEKNK